MKFEYPILEALAAVIREGTFEAAARSLNITQSAVSQRIKILEDRTGAILIIRGRPCIATEYGQMLCRHVEEVQLLEYDLDSQLRSVEHTSSGAPAVIRIAVNSDSLATWFPEVMRRAATELNLYLDLIPDDQENTAERLRSGEALAAITTLDKPLQGCRRVSLGAMEYLAVASRAFMMTQFPDGVSIDAVRAATQLQYDRKDTLPQQWLMQAFGQAVPLTGHWIPSFPGILACCLNGTGWGLMPRSSVAAHLDDGSLVELIPGKTVMMSLHWQSSAQGSEIMRLLSVIVANVARKALLPDRFRQ